MNTVWRRSILIFGVCVVTLLCMLYMIQFQYLLTNSSEEHNSKHFTLWQFEYYSTIIVDNDTLQDLQNFFYIMNNASICSSSDVVNQMMVIVVHTARSHFIQRYAVRETWGSIKQYKGWTFRLVFLLGTGNDELDTRLWEEYRQHGDMVMGNFVDSYRNLTYKHLMGYKWITSFCSDANVVLKTDDDVFVDIFHLVEVELVELVHSNHSYACQNVRGKPFRNRRSKWYVSKDLYAGDEYPAYCLGLAYLMKTHVATKIYSICDQSTFFWIDDVFVTGILRENYNRLTNYTGEKQLDILSLNGRYYLKSSRGNDIQLWCNTGLIEPFRYTVALLSKQNVVCDMFCIWNKVRLLKFAVNHAVN